MDLQASKRPANLVSPSVPAEDFFAKKSILVRIDFESWRPLTQSTHLDPDSSDHRDVENSPSSGTIKWVHWLRRLTIGNFLILLPQDPFRRLKKRKVADNRTRGEV